MDTLVKRILERDNEGGHRRSRSTTPRTSEAVAAQKRLTPSGKPELWPSAALLLLGVPQWVRLRRRVLHPATIVASNVPLYNEYSVRRNEVR